MVRETRYLWVANLPANIKEERLKDYFRRFGRVQNVKLQKEGDVIAATVAFMDIKSASKARYSDHSIDDKVLRLDYWEPGGPPPFSMRLNSEGSRSPSGSPSPGRSRSRSSGHGSPRTRRSRSSSVSSRGSKSPRVQRAKLKNSVGLGPPGGSSSEPPSLAMCVKNLPLRSSDTSLKDGLFHEYKKHGKVICVKVSGQGPERFAVVTFKKVEDLEKALEVSKDKMFFGSKIEVSRHEGSLDVEDNEFRPLEAELDEYHPKATRTLFVGNLEREISLAELRNTFIKFGDIIDVDVKKQGVNTVYAFIQYPDISSVVKAMREMDGEHLGSNRIKLGFGKSMPSPVMWIDGIGDNVPEKYLTRQMARFGPILYTVLDRRKGHAMIFFEQTKSAVAAVQEMRGRSLLGRRLQVDFASKECQLYFLDSLEPSCIDRPWEREIRELIGRPPPSRWSTSAGHLGDRRSRGATRGRASTRSVDEFSQCSSGSREDLRDALDDPPSPFNSPRRYKVELQKTRRNRSSESQGSDTEARRRRPRSDSVESVRLSSRTRKASDSRVSEKIQLSHLTEAEPTVSSDSDSECPIKKTKLSSSDSGVSDISVGDRLGLNQAEPVKECDKKLGPQPKIIPLECRRRREDDGSRPGTPLCDELDSEDILPDPRPVRERTCPRPMCLPVPKWFDLLPSFRYESPRAGKSPRSLTPKRDSSLPRSPVPADEECDSDSSVTPLVDKTLEEKLKQLDSMYEKWCSRTSGEYMPLSADMVGKYCEKPRVIDLELLKSKPSDTVQCILLRKGVFDADFERLERYNEKYEPKPIQGNEYLTRLQQLACSHLFRSQLPVETAQAQTAVEPPTSEDKSQDLQLKEETTSEPVPPPSDPSEVEPSIDDVVQETVEIKPEVQGSEVEAMEVDTEQCDAVSVPELVSEEHSEPLVVTPSPSDLTDNLVPETLKEVDTASSEVDIKEVVVDTPPSSIEQLDTRITPSEDDKPLEEVKSEQEQPSEVVNVEPEHPVVTAEPEAVTEPEVVPEEIKKEAVSTPAPPPKPSKDRKVSSQKVDRASVGSFESTLLGLEGPTLKVDQKSKTESKSRDEKRRDDKSSRSSKSSSNRDKSDRDSKSEAVKRKSTTDRDDSKRPKLDEKGKESSRNSKNRHESSHSKDKHSSRSKDLSKHHDKSKSEKSDSTEKSEKLDRSEKSDSADRSRTEKSDLADKSRSEKSESSDKSKSEKSDSTEKSRSEKSDSTEKSRAEKSDSADKVRNEKPELSEKKSDSSDKPRSEKSDEKSRTEKADSSERSKSEKSKSNSEKVRYDSEKSKSKDKSKEERSKDRTKSSSRKSDSLRDSTPKSDRTKSPTPPVRIEESNEQNADTSSFFPDLSSSDDEAPKSAPHKVESKLSAPASTPVSSKSKSDKSSKSHSKKKRSIALIIDDSDEEIEKPKAEKPVVKSSPPPAESKKKESKSPKETKDEKQEAKAKAVESKAKNVEQAKAKKKLDTREVFSSDDSEDEKTKVEEVKHENSKKEVKKLEKVEPERKEKKLDVRRVFSSDDSDEDSQPVTPRAPEPPSERPRLFSSSEDEGAPPQSEPSKKGSELKKSVDKGKADQPKKTESETKSKSNKHETDNVDEVKSDLKSSNQKSPVSSRYEKIYSSDDEPIKKDVQIKSPVKQTTFFRNLLGSSSEDERPQAETTRKKKVTKKMSTLDFEAVSRDEEMPEKASKKSKSKKKKSKQQSKEKPIYTSDEELIEEKPKSKGPSNKAELKPKLISSDEELDIKPSKPSKPCISSEDEAEVEPSNHLEDQPKVKPPKVKAKVKEENFSEDEVKIKKGPKSKPELKQISHEEKKWTPPKPTGRSFFSNEGEVYKSKEPTPERERHPSSKSSKSKSKKSKSIASFTSDEESAREAKSKPKPRTKSPRARSLSDSESDSDSDLPEKNIFIVEEEPIYISMYDKVKARSCKRVSNPVPTPTPSTNEKKKSRKSSGYDSERAKSALSSCDEVEKKSKKQEKKRQEKKVLDSDDEFIASLAKAKAKVDEPIRKPKEKKKETKVMEAQTEVKRAILSEFSDEGESLAKMSHKKSKKKTEMEPEVEVRKFEISELSPPTSPIRENDTHSQLSDDNEAEMRPKPKPRARPVLSIPAKIDPDEDPFDALLKTAKPLTYSPISSPRIFKHEERENIPEKKKKKKERRESFEILSESNKNNGFVLAEQVKLKSPSCEREVVEKLLSPKSIKSEMLDLDECPPTPTMPELELVSDEARSDKSKGHKKKKKEKKNKEERLLAKKHKKSRSKSPAASREPSRTSREPSETKEVIAPKEEAPTSPRFASPEPPRCTSSPTLHDSSFEEVRPTSSLSQSSFGKGPRPVVISQKTEDAVAGLLEETFDFGGFSMKSDDDLAIVSMRAEEDRSLLYEAQKALQSLAEENQPSPLLEQALAGLAEDDTFEAKQEALATEQLQEEVEEKEPRIPFPNWQQVEQLDDKSSSRFSLFSPPPEESRLQSPKWASTFTAAAAPPATPVKEKGDEEKKETSWDLSSIMRRAMNAPSDSQRKPVITTPTREEPTMKHPAFDTIPTRPARQRRGRKSIQEDGEESTEPVGRGRGGRRKQNSRSSETELPVSSAEPPKEPTPQLPRPNIPPEVVSEPEAKNSVDSVLDAVARGREQSPQTPVSRIQSPCTTRSAPVFLPPADQPPPLTNITPPIQGPPRLQSPQANHPLFPPISQPSPSPRLQSPPPSMPNVQHLQVSGITPITPVHQPAAPVMAATTPNAVTEMGHQPKEERKEERLDQVPALSTPTRPSGVIRSGSKLEQIANRLRPADPAPAHFIPVAKVELPPGFQQSVEQQQRLEQMTVKPERPSPGAQPSATPQQRAGQPIITHGSHPQHTSPVKGPAPYSGPQGPIPSLPRELMHSPESVRIHSPFSGNRPMQGPTEKMPFEAHVHNQASQPQNQARVNNQPPHMSQNLMQHHQNIHIQGHGQIPVSNQQAPHQGMHIVQQVSLPKQVAQQQQQSLPQQSPQHPMSNHGQMRHTAPQYNPPNPQQLHGNHNPPNPQQLHGNQATGQPIQLPKQAHGQQFQPRPAMHHPVHMNPGHVPVPVQQMSIQPQRQMAPNQQTVRLPAQKTDHFLHRDQAGQNVRMPVGVHQQAPGMQPFTRTPLPAHQSTGLATQAAVHQTRPVTPAHQASKQTPHLSGEAPVGISPPLAHGGSTPLTMPLQKQLQQMREQAPGSPLTFRNPQHEVREESVTPHVPAPGMGTPFDSAPMTEVARQNAVGRPGTDIAPSAYVMYQHFLRAQQQPGGRTGFNTNDERTTDSPIMYRSPPPAPHAPAAVARTPTVQTPPQASQVPPQADSLLTLLNQRYPVMWQGLLALKNDQAAVQMHFISGNASVARGSLPRQPDGSTLPLRISQRMRLEQTQLEGVARKMQMEAEHCILLALPCGRDHMDVLQQSNNLKNGFITYLQCKQAAGIVNIAGPGSQQAAFVVHVFPSCEFGNENLARIAPDLLHRISELAHLLVIIATV